MAEYTILYWQELPSLVDARDGDASHKVQLGERFQALIDHVAMQRGLAGTDAYLEHWKRGVPEQREGTAREVAEAVAAELEARFAEIKAAASAKS